jgi:hypothetical protein
MNQDATTRAIAAESTVIDREEKKTPAFCSSCTGVEVAVELLQRLSAGAKPERLRRRPLHRVRQHRCSTASRRLQAPSINFQ